MHRSLLALIARGASRLLERLRATASSIETNERIVHSLHHDIDVVRDAPLRPGGRARGFVVARRCVSASPHAPAQRPTLRWPNSLVVTVSWLICMYVPGYRAAAE